MANPAPSSSSIDHFECPTTEYSIWDYQFEVFPMVPENKPIGGESSIAEQFFKIGQEFDSAWDFKDGVQELNTAEDVVVAEKTPTTAVVAEKMGDEIILVNRPWSFEIVSQYFHLPILQAAKELRVGEATMKKICRRLGISRWPYRKLKSLGKLITDVQHLDRFKGEAERKAIVKELEDKREMIRKDPSLELDDGTMKLREGCSSTSYKKRKHLEMLGITTFNPSVRSSLVPPLTISLDSKLEEENDVLKFLLEDSSPPNNIFED